MLNQVKAGKEIDESAERAVSRFISLNARGKQLTVEDLIKNCFLCAVNGSDSTQRDEYREKVRTYWRATFRELEDNKGKSQVKYIIDPISFLRYYLVSLGNDANKSDVYKKFRNMASDNKGDYKILLKVIVDVNKAAEVYRSLVKGQSTSSHISNIRTMTNSQYKPCYPTLMATHKVFETTQQEEIAGLLENMMFMGIILGNRYHIDKILPKVNAMIENAPRGKDKHTEQIQVAEKVKDTLKNSMEERMVAFLEALKNTRFGNTPTSAPKTRYILRRMAKALDSHDYP